jgi:hypothetical protein
MATKIVYTREKSKKASIDELNAHLNYCKDTKHPDHKGLILHPAKNYNCGGQTDADFTSAIENMSATDGWEEAICCMGEGCYHTAAERAAIEQILIDAICPDSPARVVWNENPETGKGLLHIIFPTINPEGKLNLESNKARRLKLMEALDAQVGYMLNTSSDKPAKRKKIIQTAQEVDKKYPESPESPEK